MIRCVFLVLAFTVCRANEFYQVGAQMGTDKVTGHAYHHNYHMFMRWRKHKPVKLLEIGLGCTMNTGSASINTWQAYFDSVDLYMADIDTTCARKVQNTTKNTILIGDQSSETDSDMKFPRSAEVDIPKDLMSITCQRESCAFHKCPAEEPRCP